jgi:hypothetical protein
MVYFKTKNTILGKLLEDVVILYGHFGNFYGQMVNFTAIWYILCSFGIFYPFGTYVVPR